MVEALASKFDRIMGVNNGGTSPPEFGVRDSNANCFPDFVMFHNFMHQIACIAMQ